MTVGPAEGVTSAINSNGVNDNTDANDTETPSVGQDSVTQDQNSQEESIHPAWQPLLDKMPSQLHSQITPHLREWEQGVDKKLREVHSKFEPYKAFVEGGIAPEDLNQAYGIYQAMQEDPQRVVNALVEFYKLQTPEQGQQNSNNQQQPQDSNGNEPEEGTIPFDLENHPTFQQYQKMVELMGQQMLTQKQQEDQSKADAEFDQQLEAAKKKHGDFDEQFVADKLIAAYHAEKELSIDQAVQMYKEFEQRIAQNVGKASQGAPVIMGAGGGTPVQQTTASELNSADRKKLVIDLLTAAKAQGG